MTRHATPDEIARLYETTGHLVHRRCQQMLHDPHEAMDATQWVFLRALETGFELRSTGENLRWLYQTATYRCVWLMRNQRNRARIRLVHQDELAGSPFPSAEQRTVDRDLLERVIARVDDDVAQVAMMTWAQGLEVERVAEILEVSTRTVIRRRKVFEDELRTLMADREAG